LSAADAHRLTFRVKILTHSGQVAPWFFPPWNTHAVFLLSGEVLITGLPFLRAFGGLSWELRRSFWPPFFFKTSFPGPFTKIFSLLKKALSPLFSTRTDSSYRANFPAPCLFFFFFSTSRPPRPIRQRDPPLGTRDFPLPSGSLHEILKRTCLVSSLKRRLAAFNLQAPSTRPPSPAILLLPVFLFFPLFGEWPVLASPPFVPAFHRRSLCISVSLFSYPGEIRLPSGLERVFTSGRRTSPPFAMNSCCVYDPPFLFFSSYDTFVSGNFVARSSILGRRFPFACIGIDLPPSEIPPHHFPMPSLFKKTLAAFCKLGA